jgi:DNA-binding response OmpR family regulator
VEKVGILIIDDDEQSQSALWHVLDSEGWKLRVVPEAPKALAELAKGGWALVIVNIRLSGVDGPLFHILKELAIAPALHGEKRRARVLFLVPLPVAATVQPVLERDRLPYVHKPYHLHDFLEKVSDLLLEVRAIEESLRPVLREEKPAGPRSKAAKSAAARAPQMFASRDDYQMSEEEITEWEQQEELERKKKKKKKEDFTF